MLVNNLPCCQASGQLVSRMSQREQQKLHLPDMRLNKVADLAEGVVSKLKCPVLLAREVSGYGLLMKAVGKWESRRDFQGGAATVFSTARRKRDFFSSSGTPAAV